MQYATNLDPVKKEKQNGSSLIEVMVALFILAIGLLGVLSMQVKSMQYSQSSYYYTQAAYLANEILEGMRSNSGVVQSYLVKMNEQVTKPSVDCTVGNVTCTPGQLKDLDVFQWRQNVESTLISGKSSIEELGDFIAIKVQFDDSRGQVEKNAVNPILSEYVLVTEIN